VSFHCDCDYTHEYENPISDSEHTDYSDFSNGVGLVSDFDELYSDSGSIDPGTIDDS
jgi:hypothetical protein